MLTRPWPTVALAGLLAACGPRMSLPPLSTHVPAALAPADSAALLARTLAPVLYLHRDETFPIDRVVAVVHPERRVIAYHILWRDDVHGAWLPFTKATDQEIVWVGYDSTLAPTDLWTYWHGRILHADWRGRGTPAVDVQWGKHGSLPRNTREGDLPLTRRLPVYWALAWLGAPDIWLSRLQRPGPAGFYHGYRRYRAFDRPLWLGDRIDVVARARDPDPTLGAVFGRPYSRKPAWPWAVD